jgi:inner membrane protein
MPWWGWMASGLTLFAIELGVVDTGFYLVFLGASALAVGLFVLGSGSTSPSVQWVLFAGVALLSLGLFRGRVYARLRRTAPDLPEGTSGEWATARERIGPGDTGRVELRGTPWSARNVGTTPIEAGSHVRVLRTESVLLLVQAEPA